MSSSFKNDTTFIGYVTQYWTSGIRTIEMHQNESYPNMVKVLWPGKRMYAFIHGEGKNWHRTKESAIARCEALRVKEIQKLQVKLDKLLNQKFEI